MTEMSTPMHATVAAKVFNRERLVREALRDAGEACELELWLDANVADGSRG